MCGRFDNHLPKMLTWAHMLQHWPDVPLSYNVTPNSQIAAFATAQAQESLTGMPMRWGMVPSWAKEFSSKYATFNARIETVADKPTFHSAWKAQRRCLIPMAGYYEWSTTPDGKQPFYITDRNVGGLVAAGLYEIWLDAQQQPHYSCTMITRPADLGLDRIHARMPVLLTPSSADAWLHKASDDQQASLLEAVTPEVVYWPVDRAVGNVRNDHDGLPKPIDLDDPSLA